MALQLRSPNPMRDAQIARARANALIEQAPPEATRVFRSLIAYPTLRGLSAEQVSQRLGRGINAVILGMAMLVQQARAAAGSPVLASTIAQQIGRHMTTDEVLARFGSIAAPNASSPSPGDAGDAGDYDAGAPRHHRGGFRGRRHFGGFGGGGGVYYDSPVYILRPSILDDCLSVLPEHCRRSPIVQRMMYLAGVGSTSQAPVAAGDAGAFEGMVASDPTFQWFWKVGAGQNPSWYAKRVTGDDRRYPEIMDANPEKATVGSRSSPYSTGFNFKSLIAGETLKTPKAWNIYIATDGTPTGGVVLPKGGAPPAIPPVPTPSGDTYSSTLPAGAITAVKLQLGAWGKKEGTLTTYPGPFDVNDTIDESFLSAVRSFQNWSNTKKGTSLRTDGRLDKATHDAINAYSVGSVSAPPATPPTGIPPLIPPKGGGGGTTAPPIAVSVEKKKVGGSAGPILAVMALGLAKVANLI